MESGHPYASAGTPVSLAFRHVDRAAALSARLIDRAGGARVVYGATALPCWLVDRAPAFSSRLVDCAATLTEGLVDCASTLTAWFINRAASPLWLVYGATTVAVRLVDRTASALWLIDSATPFREADLSCSPSSGGPIYRASHYYPPAYFQAPCIFGTYYLLFSGQSKASIRKSETVRLRAERHPAPRSQLSR